MSVMYLLSTLLLVMMIVLCVGVVLRACCLAPYGASRVEDIRRLRQEGLAVNQDGEG